VVAAPKLIHAAGCKSEVSRGERAQNHKKKKEKADRAQAAAAGAGLFPPGALLHHFDFQHAQRMFGIDRFGLAAAVGIHRKES
jgi:hypothetical protein